MLNIKLSHYFSRLKLVIRMIDMHEKRFFNTKKPFKKLYIFILRHFGLFLIHLQSKKSFKFFLTEDGLRIIRNVSK